MCFCSLHNKHVLYNHIENVKKPIDNQINTD